ncbi:MAG: VIT1/CCC1 transporter family protein [Mycobacterium sp.]
MADERAEAGVYRDLAARRTGYEREILLGLAAAEARHERHWLNLLGEHVGKPRRTAPRTRILGFLVRHFGSVFVLALVQRAEARSTYDTDVDVTPTMAADERVHEEVVRALAARGRNRLSGSFRAAVFGANDGLVSNLALVLGVSAAGVTTHTVLATGIAGLLAGALSMGAGEYVSVSSQRELLEASSPNPDARAALPQLDVDANELALVYRARGMSPAEANIKAEDVLRGLRRDGAGAMVETESPASHEAVGSGLGAGLSSFCCFASGALIPVLPFLFGMHGVLAICVAAALVGATLLGTGVIVGLLSGGPPLRRALRQLLIGYGAAAITYLLGLLFGAGAG